MNSLLKRLFPSLFIVHEKEVVTINNFCKITKEDVLVLDKVSMSNEHPSNVFYKIPTDQRNGSCLEIVQQDESNLLETKINGNNKCGNDTQNNSRHLNQSILKKTRKCNKFLTTCDKCGHYRFVRCNTKRVINETYPYEHSSRGGCKVDSRNHVPVGNRFRRICKCRFCIEAAQMFHHDPPVRKKKSRGFVHRADENVITC